MRLARTKSESVHLLTRCARLFGTTILNDIFVPRAADGSSQAKLNDANTSQHGHALMDQSDEYSLEHHLSLFACLRETV